MPFSKSVRAINFLDGTLKAFSGCTWNTIGILPPELHSNNLFWQSRVCSEVNGKVFIVNTAKMTLHCLDVTSREWTGEIPIDTRYRVNLASMACCKGRIYISGGVRDGMVKPCNTTISLLVQGQVSCKTCKTRVRVKQEPNMIYKRFSHSMVCVGQRVVVCGGELNDPKSSCEMFDPVTRSWYQLKYFSQCRVFVGLIPCMNTMFVLGGLSVKEDESGIVSSESGAVSQYDWHTKRWESLPRLPVSLSHIQAVYSNGSLWVVAAKTLSAGRLGCLLEYNLERHLWIIHRPIPDIAAPGFEVFPFTTIR